MSAPLALAFALAFALGLAVTAVLWPLQSWSPPVLLLRAALAFGCGLGLTSALLFVWPLGFGTSGNVRAEVALLVALIAGAAWRLRRSRLRWSSCHTVAVWPGVWLMLSTLGLALSAAVVQFGLQVVNYPNGEWDASAIWNRRTRFLFRGLDHWRAAFDPALAWSHTDYPLLLPASVARIWKLLGTDSQLAPILIGFGFMLATVALLFAALTLLRGVSQGGLGAFALLATPYFARLAGFEYADLPLSYFILASLALLCLHEAQGTSHRGLLLLAGCCASLAAWTKNEGLLFFVVVTVVWVGVMTWRCGGVEGGRQLLTFGLGCVPMLAVLVLFKTQLAPENDIFASGDGSVLSRIMAHLDLAPAAPLPPLAGIDLRLSDDGACAGGGDGVLVAGTASARGRPESVVLTVSSDASS